jgi:hypothetical protein
MLKSVVSTRLQILFAIAAAFAIAIGNSPVNAESTMAEEENPEAVVPYNNLCVDDALVVGDQVTIGDQTYTLEEDEDGLHIEYMLVSADTGEPVSDEVGTYSLTEFAEDCETATFQVVDGVDSIVGEDVDE